jgi:hypothetical protein
MSSYTQYAVLDDGYNSNVGASTAATLGPTLIGTVSAGYSASASFNSKAIDLRNIQQFGALCSFLSGSTLAGTLALQVSDDKEAPNQGDNTVPNVSYANWLTLTASNVAGTQIVAAASVTSGAVNVPFEYSLPGHRWIRFVFTRNSGSGLVSFAYTLKST